MPTPRNTGKQVATTLNTAELAWLTELATRDGVTGAAVLRTAFLRYARTEGIAAANGLATGRESAA